MRKYVEVRHQIFIAAPVQDVQSQFADLHHHIEHNVHPKLRFEVLEQGPRRARFRQEVKLLGLPQRDVFERTIDEDGSIHDLSVEGANKGGRLDFRFTQQSHAGRDGTCVDIRIALPTPPLMGWLAPLMKSQVTREVTAAAEEDKRDIEGGYRAPAAWATA